VIRRKCPDNHVNYEITPYNFSEGLLNENKHFCPVCGKKLIQEGSNKDYKGTYTKEGFKWK
jgi:rRNA maturation endonuclease Nob1